jgi:hypothetical protein
MGASLRRHNETRFREEISDILGMILEWWF